MNRAIASESMIFKATRGLALASSVKRTLAHCLFWMQHATHSDEGVPTIWKTGPELEKELSIAARTANSHLKKLAAQGFWALSYKPKPGTIGPVSWLTLRQRGAELIELALSHSSHRNGKKSPIRSDAKYPLSDQKSAGQTSQNMTSKQAHKTKNTTKKPASFLLSGKGKKEALQASFAKATKGNPVAPSYLKVSAAGQAFAGVVFEIWISRGLRNWDWSSKFAWEYAEEVAARLKKLGFTTEDTWRNFLNVILDEWSWMRGCLHWRYASHETNLHAPSPMALAHEFDRIFSMFEDKTKPPKKKSKFSSLDGGL